MNRTETQLQQLNDIRLPNEARLRMREELVAYATLHTVPASKAVRSPFQYFSTRLYAGLAAVALILVGLGGTAYASESALPGDTLYSVKVAIAEPLQGALVPNAEGKATWHAILAERRLEETAQLAARGTLSPRAQTELATNLTAQVNASQDDADQLVQMGDTVASLSARSDLEARLSAHQRILSVISEHYATATSTDAQTTHTELEHMLAVVSDHEKAVTSSRVALEDSLSTGAVVHPRFSAKLALGPQTRAKVHIDATAAARTAEEDNILARHAMMLAPFLVVSTTTATTTATTTSPVEAATTTQNAVLKNDVMQEQSQPQP